MTANYIRRKDKQAWGFTAGEDGQIKLGVPNTGDQDDMMSDTEGGRRNGGGGSFPPEEEITLEYLQSLKAKELRALAKEHDIELETKAANASAETIRKELIEYYELEAE